VRRGRIKHIAQSEKNSLERQRKQYETAFMIASRSGTSTLYLNGLDIKWAQLNLPQPSDDTIAKILRAQPELSHFPEALRKFASAPGSDLDLMTMSDTISIVKAGVLCAKVPWLHDENLLQTVHAAPLVWHKPWFDSIAVNAGIQGDIQPAPGELWYAQLRLLFLINGKKLAFIRWYIKSPNPNRDVLQDLGCLSLEWEHVTNQRGLVTQPALFDVIDFEDILKRVYICPDFARNASTGKEDQYFKVNPWKWGRGVPNKAGFAAEEPEVGHISDDE